MIASRSRDSKATFCRVCDVIRSFYDCPNVDDKVSNLFCRLCDVIGPFHFCPNLDDKLSNLFSRWCDVIRPFHDCPIQLVLVSALLTIRGPKYEHKLRI